MSDGHRSRRHFFPLRVGKPSIPARGALWTVLWWALLTLLAPPLWASDTQAADTPELEPLAWVYPWKFASAPIMYRGRLWFAHANKWPDHNSADIWTIRPDGRDIRRIRRLFSQDVGQPVVHNGLLYWPHEDPRASLGWGEVTVTDGENWRVLQTRTSRQFHLHSLKIDRGRLLAAGSAWSTQILQSTDGGATWTTRYERERLENRFSRTYHLIPTPFGLFGDVIAFGGGPRTFELLRHGPDRAEPMPDWPASQGLVRGTARWRDGFLVLRGLGSPQELVFVQPEETSTIPLPDGVTAIDIDTHKGIWLLGRTASRQHGLWIRLAGSWQQRFQFEGDEALGLKLLGGKPVVTGSNEGSGMVWGRPGPARPEVPGTLPIQITPQPFERDEALRQIREALDDPRNYAGHGLGLRDVLDKWVTRGLPGTELERFLNGPFPEGEPVRLIGGRAFASHERFGRWLLTWAMRTSGSGAIPDGWLSLPFDEPENASAKYFSEPIAAIWTAARNRRGDSAAAKRLLDRHTAKQDPEWLRADIYAAYKLVR